MDKDMIKAAEQEIVQEEAHDRMNFAKSLIRERRKHELCERKDDASQVQERLDNFDDEYPVRTVGIDPDLRQAMADRFFQVLVDKNIGSTMVTQFIGEVPFSKAAPHRHLYEESLIILRGEGYMWTEQGKARVACGDVIFLPAKQEHSLQCTDVGGMLLAGVIYPGDNPSINY